MLRVPPPQVKLKDRVEPAAADSPPAVGPALKPPPTIRPPDVPPAAPAAIPATPASDAGEKVKEADEFEEVEDKTEIMWRPPPDGSAPQPVGEETVATPAPPSTPAPSSVPSGARAAPDRSSERMATVSDAPRHDAPPRDAAPRDAAPRDAAPRDAAPPVRPPESATPGSPADPASTAGTGKAAAGQSREADGDDASDDRTVNANLALSEDVTCNVLLSAESATIRLERILPANREGAAFLEKPLCLVGRALDCNVRLYSRSASRRHAQIERRGTGWYLSPLDGRIVLVDGQPLDGEVTLRHQMRLRFGDDELLVVDPAAPQPGAVDPSGVRVDPSGVRVDPSGVLSDPSGVLSDPSEVRWASLTLVVIGTGILTVLMVVAWLLLRILGFL
jgi:hypothetical protein